MANKTVSISFKIDDGNGGLKKVTMDAAEFRKMMNATVQEVEAVKKSLFNFTSVAVGISTANNALSQFMNTLNDFTADSREFTNAMRATNTMAGKSTEDFNKLKDSVSELSKSVPVAREQLAQGLYQVISNGVPEDNWLSFLEATARSSVGGIADLGQAVGVTSTLIKNYGLAWSDAASIQDKIQLTAKNGVTSFEQLASALPRVAGNAATLGVSIDDLMASFATLTGVSGNTAEVSTQIAAIFMALVKPSSEAGKMAEAMGIQFDAAAIKAAGGFSAFLTQLDSSVKAYAKSSGVLEQEIYGKLFGSAESLRALIPLTGELREKFQSNIAAMKGSAGTMDEAFAQMANTSDAKAQEMKNSFAMIGDAVNYITGPIKPLMSLGSTALQTTANIGILAMSLKPLKAQLIVPFFHSVSKACGLMGTAFVKITPFMSRASIGLNLFARACGVGQKSAYALSMSLHALTAATIIGALAALAYLIYRISNANSEAADKARQAQQQEKALTDIRNEAASKLAEQTTAINTLLAAAKNEKLSLDERRTAIDRLNKMIPDYNGKLDETGKKYTANTEAVQKYTDALRRQYEIEGAQSQIKDAAAAKAKALVEIAKKEKELADFRKRQREVQSESAAFRPGGGTVVGSANAVATSSFAAEAGKMTSAIVELRKTVKDQDALIAAIDKVYGTDIQKAAVAPSAPEADVDDNGPSSKDKVSAPKGSIADLENQIGDIDKKIKFSVDPDSIMTLTLQKEELQKRIGDLEIYAKIATSGKWMADTGKELDKRPLTLPVEIDKDQLTSALQEIPSQFRRVNAESNGLSATLGNLGNVCRDAGAAFSSMGQSFEMPELNIIGTIAQALATLTLSFAQAMAKTGNPWEWVAFGITGLAQLTGMIATIKNVGKFADGGIAYGPTLGLFGEYAGASSNPEVVAPLDRLRKLIPEGNGAPVIVGGDIRIKGGDLVVALRNVTGAQALAGKRSGIR